MKVKSGIIVSIVSKCRMLDTNDIA